MHPSQRRGLIALYPLCPQKFNSDNPALSESGKDARKKTYACSPQRAAFASGAGGLGFFIRHWMQNGRKKRARKGEKGRKRMKEGRKRDQKRDEKSADGGNSGAC